MPIGHNAQAVAPWLATKAPTAHDVHAVALASENEPAGHKDGAETAGGQANPDKHGEGTMAPDSINGRNNNHTFATPDQAQLMPSSNIPRGQKLPAGHELHTAPKLPSAHDDTTDTQANTKSEMSSQMQ